MKKRTSIGITLLVIIGLTSFFIGNYKSFQEGAAKAKAQRPMIYKTSLAKRGIDTSGIRHYGDDVDVFMFPDGKVDTIHFQDLTYTEYLLHEWGLKSE